MSDRARTLADQFGEQSRAFIATIESLPPGQLQTHCPGEQCTVAALGAHVAGIHRLAGGWIQTAALSQPLPSITMATIDQENMTQFAKDANRPKDEVLEELRRDGAQAARLVRGLSDEEMDKRQYFTLFGREVTTEDLVRNVLIADVQAHLATLQDVVAGAASSH